MVCMYVCGAMPVSFIMCPDSNKHYYQMGKTDVSSIMLVMTNHLVCVGP